MHNLPGEKREADSEGEGEEEGRKEGAEREDIYIQYTHRERY